AERLANQLAIPAHDRAAFLHAARADRLATLSQWASQAPMAPAGRARPVGLSPSLVVPDLPSDLPPLTTRDRRLGDLPAQPTAFIGRDTERMLLRVLLQ